MPDVRSGSGGPGAASADPGDSGDSGGPVWQVRRFASIDSTNRYLLDEARAGAPEGVVAVADHQEAGRGRLGREWRAPPGSSLLVSVLLRPAIAPEQLMLVTMAAGLALAEAVEQVARVAVSLKWPNDLMVDDRKLAGLLAEADLTAGADARTPVVVVGAGCNVQWDAFPPELQGSATACNLEAGHPVDRDALLDAYLARLAVRYRPIAGSGVARPRAGGSGAGAGAAGLLADYRARLGTVGRRVQVELSAGRVAVGEAVGVDDSGRLLVRTPAAGPGEPGRVLELAAGDVVHLRPADDPGPGGGAAARPR